LSKRPGRVENPDSLEMESTTSLMVHAMILGTRFYLLAVFFVIFDLEAAFLVA